MLEAHRGGVAGKKFLVEHAAETGAVRALQIFVNDHVHRALLRAFHQMPIRRECGCECREDCQASDNRSLTVAARKPHAEPRVKTSGASYVRGLLQRKRQASFRSNPDPLTFSH